MIEPLFKPTTLVKPSQFQFHVDLSGYRVTKMRCYHGNEVTSESVLRFERSLEVGGGELLYHVDHVTCKDIASS